jgi:hypothetical protein
MSSIEINNVQNVTLSVWPNAKTKEVHCIQGSCQYLVLRKWLFPPEKTVFNLTVLSGDLSIFHAITCNNHWQFDRSKSRTS